MTDSNNMDPLHGVTLKMMVTQLEEKYGWEELGLKIRIKCFTHDPSINSSLKFLRKTPWARTKVETLYLETHCQGSNVWEQANARRKDATTK